MRKKNSGWAHVLHKVGALGCGVIVLLQLAMAVPQLFGMQLFAITSGSMEPEIPTGSIVYTKKTEPASLQTGDIIVFASGADGGFVTHRVARNDTGAGKVTTKGDANDVEDPMPVSYEQIFGKVNRHLPLLGFVAGRTGKIVCLVLFLVFIGLMTLGQKGMPKKGQMTKEDTSGGEEA